MSIIIDPKMDDMLSTYNTLLFSTDSNLLFYLLKNNEVYNRIF
jgi:hypothetical protein